jgi:ferritin
MMISKKMAKRLNDQVNNEFFAFWTYQAMAYAFEDMGFKGFAGWFHAQAQEEMGHAQKIAKYLIDQGAGVKLSTLAAPKATYKSVAEIVQGALDHELKVTKDINEIAAMAIKENDHATRQFNDWFVAEQVEEVATITEILDLVKKAQTPGQLLMIERGLSRGEG